MRKALLNDPIRYTTFSDILFQTSQTFLAGPQGPRIKGIHSNESNKAPSLFKGRCVQLRREVGEERGE